MYVCMYPHMKLLVAVTSDSIQIWPPTLLLHLSLRPPLPSTPNPHVRKAVRSIRCMHACHVPLSLAIVPHHPRNQDLVIKTKALRTIPCP